MEFYELAYIVEDEQQERLAKLAEKYNKYNGWNEKDLLQFGAIALNQIDLILTFLEIKWEQIEIECIKGK